MVKARAESWKRVPVKAAGVEVAASSLGEGRGSTTASGAPAIILVKPQLGENIGFAARAMANFGLTDLGWSSPRDGWPNEKAHAAAAGAAYVVEQATHLSVSVEQRDRRARLRARIHGAPARDGEDGAVAGNRRAPS